MPYSAATSDRTGCPSCGADRHRFSQLPASYVYLLGLYLGDGTISAHPRGVYRLRIFLDKKYPQIVAECSVAMHHCNPGKSIARLLTPSNCYQVSSYSKSWPCLLPQHGPGRKHTRRIELDDWQQVLVAEQPELLLRGLVHSDGCRFINTGRGGWRCPRYAFANNSDDIKRIFCDACDLLDLHWTVALPKHVYVSRKADVARMDEFIGPKT